MPRLPKHSRVGKVYGMQKICSIAALWLRVADAVHDTVRVSCAHGCARQLRVVYSNVGIWQTKRAVRQLIGLYSTGVNMATPVS